MELRFDPESTRLLHEPARLMIMIVLGACQSADFVFLQRATGLTKGNLSSHLSRLEEAGYVQITKQFIGKLPNTQIGLTEAGRAALEQHWKQLDDLRRQGDQLRQQQAKG